MPNKHTLTLHFETFAFQRALLGWYKAARRDLPWRAKPGVAPDPYRVWLSEIMLQQTTVKAVIPYFERFLEKWPTADALGAAPRDELLAAWAGLGYYARARNLHACAKLVAQNGFPPDEAGLRLLPGVGAYTAAAIAAIAFEQPAAVVDGNVERVLSRLFAIEDPLPAAKPAIRELAACLTPRQSPGDYAQAMMDLGATICTPRTPSCLVCPVRGFCKAIGLDDPARFPLKAPKAIRPTRRGDSFVIVQNRKSQPAILLRRRVDKGLLGGMMEVPCTEWVIDEAVPDRGPPDGGDWKQAATVQHSFTHFHLEMRVYAAEHCAGMNAERIFGGQWAPLENCAAFGLPAVMKKAVAAGLEVLGMSGYSLGNAASKASSVISVERSARPSTKEGRK